MPGMRCWSYHKESIIMSADCDVWKSLSLRQKEGKVPCVKHPWALKHTTHSCPYRSSCWNCQSADHHQVLCLKNVHSTTKFGQAASKGKESSDELPPVLLPAMFVRGVRGTYGALLGNCSMDNYIVNNVARRQKLRCVRKVHLEVEGMCGEVFRMESKVDEVPVKEDNDKTHIQECFGVNVISRPVGLPDTRSYTAICRQFNVPPAKMERPRRIDLLISMRENHLLPEKSGL